MYSDKQKRVIGILCCQQMIRESTSGYILPSRQMYFYVDDKTEAICSRRTLMRVSKGETSPNDKIYDGLLVFTKMKYVESEILDKDIEALFDGLLEWIDNDILAMEYIQELLNKLSAYKDALYYRECYQVTLDIKKHYIEGAYIDNNMHEYYCTILKCFPIAVQVLLQNLFFQYGAFVETNRNLMSDIIRQYDFKQSAFPLLRMKYGLFLKYQEEFQDSYLVLDALQNHYKTSKNVWRYIDICNSKANVANIIKRNEVGNLEQEIQVKMELAGENMTDAYRSIHYYMMGMRHFYNDEYDLAIQYFNDSLKLGNPRREKEIHMFLVFMRQKFQFVHSLDLFDETLVCIHNNITDRCYQYFVKKKQHSMPAVLENYILEEVATHFSHFDSFFMTMMEDEMIEMNKKTTNYKKLARYRGIVKEVMKKGTLRNHGVS